MSTTPLVHDGCERSAPLTPATPGRHTAASNLDAWRAGKSPNTLRSYQHDLEAFAAYLGTAIGVPLTVDGALERLFGEESANAHALVLTFRATMLNSNLAPASINERSRRFARSRSWPACSASSPVAGTSKCRA